MFRFESVVIPVVGIFLVKSLLSYIRVKLRRRSLARRFGCKPVKTYRQYDKFLGLLFLYQNIRNYQAQTFLESWERYLAKTGRTLEFWLLGQRMLVTSDPENLKTILATSFDDFEKGPRVRAGFAPLIGNGIFGADGKDWHEARALLRPSFAKGEMNDTQRFETHYQSFLRLLPADGVAIDLQGLLSRLSMDTATDLLFGRSTGSLSSSEDSEAARFSSAADIALQAAFRDICVQSFGKLLDRQDSKGARAYVHKTVDRYVREALENRPKGLGDAAHAPGGKTAKRKGYVFLESLMEKTNDADTLRNQSLGALYGGRDTTSSLLSNLLYVLARRPDIWEKLKREAQTLGGQPPNQETIKNVPYLSHCINECKSLPPYVYDTLKYVIPKTQSCSQAAIFQLSAFIPSSPSTPAGATKTPSYPEAAERTAPLRSSCARARR